MAKGGKDFPVTVILERISCVRKSINKEFAGISRYITQKNRAQITKPVVSNIRYSS